MWQISWKILVSFGLAQVQSLKTIYLAYQSRIFENSTKISKFSKISEFPAFLGFHCEQWSQFKKKKTETKENWQFGWILDCHIGVSFLRLLIMFFSEKNFFRLVRYYFPAFPAFPSNRIGRLSEGLLNRE